MSVRRSDCVGLLFFNLLFVDGTQERLFEETNKMATQQGSLARYAEESHGSRLARKSQEAPLFPIGIAGLTLACLYGAYKFKHRGSMSTSVFLMQLRVAAQGTVVVCLTGGVAYSLFRDYVMKHDDPTGKKE